jgi:hypothetical protein
MKIINNKMKYLEKFESFKITEGIFGIPKLSDIKSKVKQFLSKDKKEGEMMEEEEEEELKKSYKFRSPTRVSREKWRSKLSYKKVPFTKKERDLFQKLKENPKNDLYKIDLGESTIEIKRKQVEPYGRISWRHYRRIIKLDDNWYLIYYNQVDPERDPETDLEENDTWEEFFICDEWDEVIGYLEREDGLCLD